MESDQQTYEFITLARPKQSNLTTLAEIGRFDLIVECLHNFPHLANTKTIQAIINAHPPLEMGMEMLKIAKDHDPRFSLCHWPKHLTDDDMAQISDLGISFTGQSLNHMVEPSKLHVLNDLVFNRSLVDPEGMVQLACRAALKSDDHDIRAFLETLLESKPEARHPSVVIAAIRSRDLEVIKLVYQYQLTYDVDPSIVEPVANILTVPMLKILEDIGVPMGKYLLKYVACVDNIAALAYIVYNGEPAIDDDLLVSICQSGSGESVRFLMGTYPDVIWPLDAVEELLWSDCESVRSLVLDIRVSAETRNDPRLHCEILPRDERLAERMVRAGYANSR